MVTPTIEVNLSKICHNARALKTLYASKGIELIGVTKGVNGDVTIAHALVTCGIKILADSRIANIQKMSNAGVQAQFLLLRSPFLSRTRETVEYADMSLNTELVVIESLSEHAIDLGMIHQIVLMVELGDLREGILPSDLAAIVAQVLPLKGVNLIGLGTNLACFGGIGPNDNNMDQLSSITIDIEKQFGIKLPFISGGNSANHNWAMETTDIGRINNLRIGEAILLGCETLHSNAIPGLYTDAFKLVAEVIEVKTKPSYPIGDIYQNALGEVPVFVDEGLMTRAILGIGSQDVILSGLTPLLDMDIMGGSSDHLIMNAKQIPLKVGDEVAFHLNYATLLSAMCSLSVAKTSTSLWMQMYIARWLKKKTC